MGIFLRFLGWLILWSFLYFAVLDVMGLAPGKDPKLVSGAVLLLSFPIWWLTWKKFEKAFSARPARALENGKTAYYFSLRNPALMYYLMVLKLFLLVMGANGIITLEHHKGAWRTFYIWNFIILYVYAIPFFVLKLIKLKKALACRLVVDDAALTLERDNKPLSVIRLDAVDRVRVQEQGPGLVIESGAEKLYVGGQAAKGSAFYTEGAQEILGKIRERSGEKIETVDSIGQVLKQASFKPAV